MLYPTFYNGKNSRSFLSRLLWELNKLIDVKHWEYCIVHSRHYKNIKCYFYISNVHWPTPPWNYKATPNSACPKLNKPPTSTHPNYFTLLNSLCWLAATPSMQFPKLCSHSSRLSHLWSPIVGNPFTYLYYYNPSSGLLAHGQDDIHSLTFCLHCCQVIF